MTRIDFYIVPSPEVRRLQHTACRIADKAFQQGLRVHIQVDSSDTAKSLDQLLWTFRDQSFVPHAIEPHQCAAYPVTIGIQGEPPAPHQVLINLAPAIPPNFADFERVAELVSQETSARQAGRQRYRHYRELGYELTTHEL